MQTLLESICNLLASAVGCCLGAYIGLSIHNELSRRKRLKEGKINPVVIPSSETELESVVALRRWLAKWGFKKNLNMLQLMQYRLDEYHGDLGLVLKESVYARPVVNEYLVTIHGEYVFVDANTLTKMESDFYTEKVSSNNHLFAIPKDWVDEMVNKHPELILTDVE